jgi:ADP-ribose pyrophosphatase YjhB (NUDIX family)
MSPNEETLNNHRRAARVVLLDQDDRVLLLSSWLEWRDCIIWLAPGGALEDGESRDSHSPNF